MKAWLAGLAELAPGKRLDVMISSVANSAFFGAARPIGPGQTQPAGANLTLPRLQKILLTLVGCGVYGPELAPAYPKANPRISNELSHGPCRPREDSQEIPRRMEIQYADDDACSMSN